MFTVPAYEFGDSVRHNFKAEPPLPPDSDIDSVAETFVDYRVLRSVEEVKRGVIEIVAREISCEPNMRRSVRNVFRRTASVSTRPTPKGISSINPFHAFFGKHYIDRKPINDFLWGKTIDRTLFLELLDAEKDGLITVTIDAPQVRVLFYFDEWQCYASAWQRSVLSNLAMSGISVAEISLE